MGERDTQFIDHLVTREFVSGPPSYLSIHKRVRDRMPSLRESSWAVCGFRTEFFEKRHFFLGARSHLSSGCLMRIHRLLIKHHMHMLRVYGHRCWRRSPHQVYAMWRDSFIYMTWIIDVCKRIHICNVWYDSIMYVKWLNHTCDMTHWCMWDDLFVYMTWLMDVCDKTHSHIHTMTH